jgi:hypothetical protein
MKPKLFILPILSSLLIANAPGAQAAGTANNPTGTLNGNISGSINTPAGTVNTGATGNVNTNISGTANTNASGNVNANAGASTSTAIPTNMNSQQFGTFALGRWDTNGDGTLSQAEWNTTGSTWFGKKSPSFSSLDTNRNGVLDSAELQITLADSQLFQLYDTDHDGIIDSDEADKIPLRR